MKRRSSTSQITLRDSSGETLTPSKDVENTVLTGTRLDQMVHCILVAMHAYVLTKLQFTRKHPMVPDDQELEYLMTSMHSLRKESCVDWLHDCKEWWMTIPPPTLRTILNASISNFVHANGPPTWEQLQPPLRQLLVQGNLKSLFPSAAPVVNLASPGYNTRSQKRARVQCGDYMPLTVTQTPTGEDHQLIHRPADRRRRVDPPLRSTLLPPCPSCGPSAIVIEDVHAGHVVCTACGIVTHTLVTESALTHAQYHTGVSRTVGHRYTRVSYLVSIVKSVTGETQPCIEDEHKKQIRSYCEGLCMPNASGVKRAIRSLGLSQGLNRHATSLACELWRENNKALPIVRQSDIARMIRLWLAYENAWDRSSSGSFKKGRKKFVNARTLFRKIAEDEHLESLKGIFPPLKHSRTRTEQEQMIDRLKEMI